MKRFVAGGLIVAGLVAGCAPSPENNDRGHQQIFDATIDYWQAFGGRLEGMKDIRLLTVFDGETADCSVDDQSTYEPITSWASSAAYYCPLEETVLISSGKYGEKANEVTKKGLDLRAWGATVIFHELGHGVQAHEHGLEATKSNEIGADCLGGQALAAVAPELKDGVEAIYASGILGADPEGHGTTKERLESFQRGVAGEYGCPSAPMTHQESR